MFLAFYLLDSYNAVSIKELKRFAGLLVCSKFSFVVGAAKSFETVTSVSVAHALRAGVIEFLLWQRKPPRAQPPSTILKQTPPLSKRNIFLEISQFVLQERQFRAKALH